MFSVGEIGSSLAGMMFMFATFQQFFPQVMRDYIEKQLRRLVAYFSPEAHINFYEFANNGAFSKAYGAIEIYLSSISSTAYAKYLKGETANNKSGKPVIFHQEENEEVVDFFEGMLLRWTFSKTEANKMTISYYPGDDQKRYFQLTYNPNYRESVMGRYLNYVVQEGEAIEKKRRARKLFTNNPSSEWTDYKKGLWSKVKFKHPATFDNLAMDPEKKQEIVDDLITFSNSREYYGKIGKAWKRGYLLYGPPGTGKSTMIACMANLLQYDVYDIELTTVKNNTELRNLLIHTEGKAIIVVEDIDCTLPITGRRDNDDGADDKDDESSSKSDDDDEVKETQIVKPEVNKSNKSNISKVTLSGLLNFIDGLWSPCGGEKIIVFTTNHPEKLDPALVRTGRMDKHIELSYCTFGAFKVLAKNYLDIESHSLFERIERLLEEVRISPADVAEHLLPKTSNDNHEKRLNAVIQALENELEAEEEKKKEDSDSTSSEENC